METTESIACWIKAIENILTTRSFENAKQSMEEALGANPDALFQLFESTSEDKVLDSVCCHLLSMYRTKDPELSNFTMELIPAMIWSYLLAVTVNTKKVVAGIEACLLALYNLEVVNDKGQQKVDVITIPSLGRPSIYHEPNNLGSSVLTESALSRYEQGDRKAFRGPFPVVDKINAKNRLSVLSHLLRCYDLIIGRMSSRSHRSLCDLAIRLACCGFCSELPLPSPGGPRRAPERSESLDQSGVAAKASACQSRVCTSSELLVELTHGVYYVLFNDEPTLGLDALRCLQFRAAHELYADAILVTRAMVSTVENSLKMWSTPASLSSATAPLRGQPWLCDVSSTMGVSIVLTPSFHFNGVGSSAGVSKGAITNASFRAHKLPDDIAVDVTQQQVPASGGAANGLQVTPLLEKKGTGLSSLKLGPIRSALKKVERSIAVRKDDGSGKKEDKDGVTGSKDGKEKSDQRTPKKSLAKNVTYGDPAQADSSASTPSTTALSNGVSGEENPASSGQIWDADFDCAPRIVLEACESAETDAVQLEMLNDEEQYELAADTSLPASPSTSKLEASKQVTFVSTSEGIALSDEAVVVSV